MFGQSWMLTQCRNDAGSLQSIACPPVMCNVDPMLHQCCVGVEMLAQHTDSAGPTSWLRCVARVQIQQDDQSSATPLVCLILDQQSAGKKYLNLKALKYFSINQESKGFFQFEIIINVLANYFRFI